MAASRLHTSIKEATAIEMNGTRCYKSLAFYTIWSIYLEEKTMVYFVDFF